jgi:hypothetical protein
METASSSQSKSSSGNQNVRMIMDCLLEQYPSCPRDDWRRLRQYLYRRSYGNLPLTRSQVQAVLQFLEQSFPKNPDLPALIVQSAPKILRQPVDTFLRPTVEFLTMLYGDDLLATAVERNPHLLLTRGVGYNAGSLPLVEVYLQQQLQLSQSAIYKLQQNAPFVFQMPVHKLIVFVEYLQTIFQKGKCHSESQIQTMIANMITKYPTLLNLSVVDNLQPRLDYLQESCHLNDSDMATLLSSSSAAATIMGLSVSSNLKPTVALLSKRITSEEDWRRCILKHPPLLALSLDNLQTKLDYFDSIDDDSSQTSDIISNTSPLASRILMRAPSVYSLSLTENIMPKIACLAKMWGRPVPAGIATKETATATSAPAADPVLAALLGEMPSILGLSLEGNLQPTLQFYNRTGYIQLDEHWQNQQQLSSSSSDVNSSNTMRIIRGRDLSVSLFSRLLPRYHFVFNLYKEKQQADGLVVLPCPLIPLNILVGASDDSFCERYNVSIKEYRDFQAEATPRLKFSSQFDWWLKTGRPMDLE